MAQAYDFALEKIGMDIHSYNIWQDYITFLSSVEAVGSYAENQKITAIRKVIKFYYFSLIFLSILYYSFDILGLSTWCCKSYD